MSQFPYYNSVVYEVVKQELENGFTTKRIKSKSKTSSEFSVRYDSIFDENIDYSSTILSNSSQNDFFRLLFYVDPDSTINQDCLKNSDWFLIIKVDMVKELITRQQFSDVIFSTIESIINGNIKQLPNTVFDYFIECNVGNEKLKIYLNQNKTERDWTIYKIELLE